MPKYDPKMNYFLWQSFCLTLNFIDFSLSSFTYPKMNLFCKFTFVWGKNEFGKSFHFFSRRCHRALELLSILKEECIFFSAKIDLEMVFKFESNHRATWKRYRCHLNICRTNARNHTIVSRMKNEKTRFPFNEIVPELNKQELFENLLLSSFC